MEVLVGPTFNIDVPSSPPPGYAAPPQQDEYQADGRAEKAVISRRRIGSDFGTEEDSSDSSSSIGAPDDSDEEEEGDSVVSSSKAGLGSLDSLEDSLPIKRGLSNHFSGKSKSFANLSEASSVGSAKDLEKPENPFNKRRRILMANKWSRKSSFYSWPNPKSMPLLVLNEEEDDDDDDDYEGQEEDEEDQASPASSSSPPPRHQEDREKLGISPKAHGRKFKTASFKSQSCFSLADLELQHHK